MISLFPFSFSVIFDHTHIVQLTFATQPTNAHLIFLAFVPDVLEAVYSPLQSTPLLC